MLPGAGIGRHVLPAEKERTCSSSPRQAMTPSITRLVSSVPRTGTFFPCLAYRFDRDFRHIVNHDRIEATVDPAERGVGGYLLPGSVEEEAGPAADTAVPLGKGGDGRRHRR